ncbi:nickel pincer cofactor biosynthesis protein LarC [Clostridium scatologenes]|uniref:nickel pincer cofactor biosynthesis protein LarC n=1 Tax=Clostridium scatologenes TaxID=1548 RepID=UPI0004910EDE|nr:nickel pincer cofactor biosynthesis protein LarC [Clostridium scatologenes]
MLKILYYDCFSGISGDMNLSALVDIGVDKEYLLKELLKLNFNNYKIEISKDIRKGIYGTKVNVFSSKSNDCKQRTDNRENDKEFKYFYKYRNLKDIENMINSSTLKENVKKNALKIFKRLVDAEAKIHGKSLENVNIHEIGSVDSIIYIVGAAICLDYLKIDKVKSSTIEVGSGFVECEHGMFPVPLPATAEILKNAQISSKVSFEATNLIGAGILANYADEFTDEKSFKITKIGYGIGHENVDNIPNILRVFVGEEVGNKEDDYLTDEVLVMECNIDDMNPEFYEYVIELLFDQGALDVYMIPIIMKKQRPAVKLNVLCKIEQENNIKDIILTNTTTLGFRKYKVNRSILKRGMDKVDTKYGEITVKSAYYRGNKIKSKPEYEECKKAALENNIPISEVYKEVFSKIK